MISKLASEARIQQIKELRSEGMSLGAIATQLECSKSIVSYHCKGTERLPNHRLNARLGSKANCDKWLVIRNIAKNEAVAQWPTIRSDPNMMAFLAFYWAEGAKRGSEIAVVNNDPGVIKICHNALANLGLKIVTTVRCYPEHDKSICKTFWQKLLNGVVKLNDKQWLGKIRRCRSQFGLCVIRGSDIRLKMRILTWLRLWRAEHIKTYQDDWEQKPLSKETHTLPSIYHEEPMPVYHISANFSDRRNQGRSSC